MISFQFHQGYCHISRPGNYLRCKLAKHFDWTPLITCTAHFVHFLAKVCFQKWFRGKYWRGRTTLPVRRKTDGLQFFNELLSLSIVRSENNSKLQKKSKSELRTRKMSRGWWRHRPGGSQNNEASDSKTMRYFFFSFSFFLHKSMASFNHGVISHFRIIKLKTSNFIKVTLILFFDLNEVSLFFQVSV